MLAFRLSYTDWIDGGWSIEDAERLASDLKQDGVDLIDVSSGGNSPATVALMSELRGQSPLTQKTSGVIPLAPGYQVPGATRIRTSAQVPVSAVGLITEPHHAESIVRNEQADLVMLARELLRDPNWPIHAAIKLKQTSKMRIPVQYHLAWKNLGSFSYTPVSAPCLSEVSANRE